MNKGARKQQHVKSSLCASMESTRLHHNRAMKLTRSQVIWVGLISLSAVAALVLNNRGLPVEVTVVSQGQLVQSVVTSGRMTDVSRTEISSQITARIDQILVREGDLVKPGQILVRLRDDEAQATLRQAEAAVLEARMRIRQIQTIQGPVSDQQLEQARASNQQTQQELSRTQALVRQGFVSQSRLDDVLRAANTSNAALQAASAQAQGNRVGGAEVALAQARLEQALAARSVALVRLDQLSLRAPSGATVITRTADPGDTAQAGRSLLTLVGGGETRIQASVDEKNLRFLKLGQMARATADAYVDRHFAALLTYIAPSVDAQRGTVELKLRVDPPVDYLRPDMTVSIEIITAQSPNALMLPSDALRHDTSGALFVLVNQDGRARQVAVQTGLQGIGTTEIAKGLSKGDRVILPGTNAIDGDRVREQAERAPRGNAQPIPGLTSQ